jgi:hypothetical protein
MRLWQPLAVWPLPPHYDNLALRTKAEAIFIEFLFSVAVLIACHISLSYGAGLHKALEVNQRSCKFISNSEVTMWILQRVAPRTRQRVRGRLVSDLRGQADLALWETGPR